MSETKLVNFVVDVELLAKFDELTPKGLSRTDVLTTFMKQFVEGNFRIDIEPQKIHLIGVNK